ncbi:MAG: EamA family transporter [Clostridia bacterium]|nr:EamA family transporter [Clostridia bacterium]
MIALRCFLLIIMTIVAAFGGYHFKMITHGGAQHKNPMKSVHFYYGIGYYAISAVINIYLLRFLPLTFVLPATSLSYIWIQLISKFRLGEAIRINKMIAMVIISLGVLLIGIG